MSDETVLKESEGADGRQYRVRLEVDEGGDEPYDDGSVPLWRIDYNEHYAWRAEQVGMTSFDASDVALGEAVARFGGPTEPEVERWLRAFHGVTVVETWHSGDAWYLAADTAKWRDAMGVTPEQIREEAERGSLMSEYQAWVKGDVYGYVVERKAVEYTVVTETSGQVIGTRRAETWVEVEDGSLWELYGYERAARAAEEALDDLITSARIKD